MKISPVSAAAAPAAATPPPVSTRSFRMATNATPGMVDPPPISDDREETVAAPEAPQPLSPQLALLRKQQRTLQLERQAFEREKADLAKSSAQGDGVTLADLKSDPMGFLRKAGLSYDDLVTHVANDGGSAHEVQALKSEIEKLRGEVDKKFTDRTQTDEQQALAQMRRDALQIVNAAGETFELVRETGSVPLAVKLIERVYRESGEVMDVKEALTHIEGELFADMQKRMALPKVQRAFAPPPPPPQQRQGMRTLTNRDSAQVPLTPKQRALQAFNGTLKR